jgi:NADP-dependent 3-hydroxy acid dehydrogenase YdfG
VLNVNFLGAVHVTQAVLPFLREQRSGHIVNISSIAGFSAPPGTGFYAAAKYAFKLLAGRRLARMTKPYSLDLREKLQNGSRRETACEPLPRSSR